jgi:hypothetical protein
MSEPSARQQGLSRWTTFRRATLGPFLWLLAIIVVIAIVVEPFDSFKKCVHANKDRAEYQHLDQSSGIFSPIIRRFARLRLGTYCTADFADANERSLGAFAALALAFFTAYLYLWHATRGLRRYAGIQQRDMAALLLVANANAAAAAGQTEAMRQLHGAAEAQERAMKEQATATTAVADAARQSAEIARPRASLPKT